MPPSVISRTWRPACPWAALSSEGGSPPEQNPAASGVAWGCVFQCLCCMTLCVCVCFCVCVSHSLFSLCLSVSVCFFPTVCGFVPAEVASGLPGRWRFGGVANFAETTLLLWEAFENVAWVRHRRPPKPPGPRCSSIFLGIDGKVTRFPLPPAHTWTHPLFPRRPVCLR